MKYRRCLTLAAAIAALTLTVQAYADCVYPKAPDFTPDGTKATEQEMVTAMDQLKAYNAAVTAYLSCLDMETSARVTEAGPDAPADQVKQIRALGAKKHNAAVDELQSHADEFNKQVKAFKSKQKG